MAIVNNDDRQWPILLVRRYTRTPITNSFSDPDPALYINHPPKSFDE